MTKGKYHYTNITVIKVGTIGKMITKDFSSTYTLPENQTVFCDYTKKLYPVSKDSAKFIIKIIWMIYYIIKRIKQKYICISVCSNGWMGRYPIIQVTKQSHCIFKFNLSSTQNYWYFFLKYCFFVFKGWILLQKLAKRKQFIST